MKVQAATVNWLWDSYPDNPAMSRVETACEAVILAKVVSAQGRERKEGANHYLKERA